MQKFCQLRNLIGGLLLMRKTARTKLKRLPEKLLRIRLELCLSQNEMLVRLGFADELFRSNISQYELGRREPPLPVLLEYARAANVLLEVLVDDDLELPKELPSRTRHEGTKRMERGKGHGSK